MIEVAEIALEPAETFARVGRWRELVLLLVVAERVFRAQGWSDERAAAWLALREQLAAEVDTAASIAAARSYAIEI